MASSSIVKKYTSQENVYAISGLNLPILMKAIAFKQMTYKSWLKSLNAVTNPSLISYD